MSRHREGRPWSLPVRLSALFLALAAVAVAGLLTLTGQHGSGHPAALPSSPVTPSEQGRTSVAASHPDPTATATAIPTARRASTTAHHRSPASATAQSAPPAAGVPTGLPVQGSTGTSSQVITVSAPSTGSTTATLQAWDLREGKWVAFTAPISADVGVDGLTTRPSESRSATPIGSFTLTQAFGADPNPGTRLPYTRTDPSDWWISQSGPLYNTLQRCSGRCAFTQGVPNEHLYYETPFYDYAVVIDYNTANAGPVVQGAGSAFFLHVSNGTPTAGCVSVPPDQLVSIMRWLSPADHPRILIGAGGSAS